MFHRLSHILVLITLLLCDAATSAQSRDGDWTIELDEVTVKRNKEHYSKRNNPAVDLINDIRRTKDLNDPYRLNDYYSFTRYDRIGIALSDIDADESGLVRKFPFLREYVDTSAVSGRPILNISVREKVSTTYYRRDPQALKEYVTGISRAGIDEMLDTESMQTLLDDVLREVDIYDKDINILSNRFVSPLSPLAPDFYKFYLGDTVMVDDEPCVRISFVPRNNKTFGFTGSIFTVAGDSTHFIKKINLNVAKAINLNFIDHLSLTQTYRRGPDGARHKVTDDMTAQVSVIKGTQGLEVSRTSSYGAHNSFVSPYADIYDRMETVIVSPHASIRDESFWDAERGGSRGVSATRLSMMMAQLRSTPLYYWGEKALKILVSGYVNTGNPSKVDLGPVNTLVSTDYLEGVRFRVGGMTTANLSRHWFGRAYVAYGLKDKRFKYQGELEYSFNEKSYHSREFPVHSLRLTHRYDVNRVGQHYLYTNMDNVFLSLKRMKDRMMAYERKTMLEYTLELPNNFSVAATAYTRRLEATDHLPFEYADGTALGHYTQSGVKIKLRYAPGEKFYQTKSARIPVNLDAPVIELSHEYSPSGFAGNRFCINKTELSAQKRLWFSAWGFMDVLLKGGHVWSTVAYPDLLLPNVNLSYTIQPESFALLSPLELVYDSYACWFVTYWANGAIFNYIPLLNRLGLREVVSFSGTLGTLSRRNNPSTGAASFVMPQGAIPDMQPWHPYMELSAGIDNLFKCLRVDYVWRLNRRNIPGTDRSGVRVAFHVTF